MGGIEQMEEGWRIEHAEQLGHAYQMRGVVGCAEREDIANRIILRVSEVDAEVHRRDAH